MKKLMVISRYQFGYHTDVYKWCQHLKERYSITVVSPLGRDIKSMNDVNVIYAKSFGVRLLDYCSFLITSIVCLSRFKGIIIVDYFKGAHIIKLLFPKKRVILDIRTLSVNVDKKKRDKDNKRLYRCAQKFDFVTVISEGVRNFLNLNHQNSAILTLGADGFKTGVKSFESIRLLYVGTFYNRDLHKTILGLNQFIEKFPEAKVSYEIIGNGWGNEENDLKALVEKLTLRDYVFFRGYISQDKLSSYFEKCNVGVSFVPITEYYEYQPVTKSFEYILSGLYTIATATYSNKAIITDSNGILIDDTPESFCNALELIYHNYKLIDSEIIKSSVQGYTWKDIIFDKLVPILSNFEKEYL